MRRALLKQLPALTQFYGLRPADIDEMTYGEVAEYLAQKRKADQQQTEGR